MTITPEKKPDGYHYGVPVYKYIDIPETETTVTQILDSLDQGVYEVIFTDVPPNVIEEVFIPFDEGELRLQMPGKTYLDSFDKAKRIMTFRRFVCGHQAAPKATFPSLISKAIDAAGMKGIVMALGQRTYFTEQRIRAREPDCCWILMPTYTSPGFPHWPQVVTKHHDSAPVERQAEDAIFWLIESKGAVKVMLTLNLDVDTLSLNSWVLSDDGNEVVIEKQITASMDEDRQQWWMTSSTTELAFSVESVFGQQPVDGHDAFVITSDMFFKIAEVFEGERTMG